MAMSPEVYFRFEQYILQIAGVCRVKERARLLMEKRSGAGGMVAQHNRFAMVRFEQFRAQPSQGFPMHVDGGLWVQGNAMGHEFEFGWGVFGADPMGRP